VTDFRRLSDDVLASPQISADDLAAAAALGTTLVINNRPDGEVDGQPSGAEIETAARAIGMDYVAIPVTMATLSDADVTSMRDALERATGPVLAYCRTGTRSTLLWSLAMAKAGADPQTIAEAAAAAGYDVSPVRAAMEAYAAGAG